MKKILYIFISCIISLEAFSFTATPMRFTEDITRVATGQIVIRNDSNQPKRVEVNTKTEEWFKKFDLSDHIKIYPRVVSIPPRSERRVWFQIKPVSKLEDGEYRVDLIYKEISSEKSKSEAGVNVNLVYQGPVYGLYGDIKREGSVEVTNKILDTNKIQLESLISSIGNASIRVRSITDFITDSNKVIEETGETTFVPREMTIHIVNTIEIPEGTKEIIRKYYLLEEVDRVLTPTKLIKEEKILI